MTGKSFSVIGNTVLNSRVRLGLAVLAMGERPLCSGRNTGELIIIVLI